MSDNQLSDFKEWADANEASELPIVAMPSHEVTITESASKLFKFIAPTHQLFMRGGAVTILVRRDDGLLALEVLRPDAARSLFEKFAQLYAWRVSDDGKLVLKPVTCSRDMAEAFLQTQEASLMLPRISGLINCPVLYEANAQLAIAGQGYCADTKLLITDGDEVPVLEINDAVSHLLSLLDEFDFQTEGDRARAVASLITPALKLGGFLKRRVPVDVAEADQSQSGKTYRQKIVAALYNEKFTLVTSRSGGVGSVDESFSQALVAGRPFVQLDNFKDKFDSPHVEAFMTADGSFSCRVPYRGEITVQPDNYFIFLTSNGVDTTRDFANRSNIIRIKKKPSGFSYAKYEEGDLLDRVRFWQGYYLGCVFSVIREWHRLGQPRTEETRHDFREWVQVVDWIAQNIFKTVPVMDGHQQAQERVSNPQMVWLRKMVLTINVTGEVNRELTATDLQRICESADIAIPGLRGEADEERAKRVIGTIMAKLFGNQDSLDVDGFTVTRSSKRITRDNPLVGGSFPAKTYLIRSRQENTPATPQLPQQPQQGA